MGRDVILEHAQCTAAMTERGRRSSLQETARWSVRRILELFSLAVLVMVVLGAAWRILGADEKDPWCDSPIGFLLGRCNKVIEHVVECCKNVAGICVDTCSNLVDTCKEFLVGDEPSCGSEPPQEDIFSMMDNSGQCGT